MNAVADLDENLNKNGSGGRRTTSSPKFPKHQRALWLAEKSLDVFLIATSSLNGFAFHEGLGITGSKQML